MLMGFSHKTFIFPTLFRLLVKRQPKTKNEILNHWVPNFWVKNFLQLDTLTVKYLLLYFLLFKKKPYSKHQFCCARIHPMKGFSGYNKEN